MKVYILIKDCFPFGQIEAVFKSIKDADDQLESLGAYAEQYHVEEHEVIE